MSDKHFNDIKHAALIFQTGVITDHISDAELSYVHSLIVNPSKQSHIGGAWNQLWTESGIPAGAYNDRAVAFIRQVLPATDADDMNAYWLSYWESLLP